ncbi:hypothetical protein BG003_009940 [Podila horticola]|nr:hypothetical protein BG003_009940 [Podila horticola]
MSSRTSTVRPSRTTTKSDNSTSSQQQQETPSQDRCAHCKKFLPAVKAECRFCRLVFCMEHRHPETHSPGGCALKAREQTRQQFQRDSGHILGAEAQARGATHQPGWTLETSRQELHQRLSQRVQTLKESSGRASSSPSSSSSTTGGSTGGSGSGSGKTGGGKGKGKGKKPTAKTWGSGGSRLGGVPGTGSGGGVTGGET